MWVSPDRPVNLPGIQVWGPTLRACQPPSHPPTFHSITSGVQHLPGSHARDSPVVPAGMALPSGDARHPRTRPG